jgi:hypothetical protein
LRVVYQVLSYFEEFGVCIEPPVSYLAVTCDLSLEVAANQWDEDGRCERAQDPNEGEREFPFVHTVAMLTLRLGSPRLQDGQRSLMHSPRRIRESIRTTPNRPATTRYENRRSATVSVHRCR